MDDLWTVNPQLSNTSPLPSFRPLPNFTKKQKRVIDIEFTPQLQSFPGINTEKLRLSKNFQLKNKRRMLYLPMDSGNLTLEGLTDTNALVAAV